MAKFDFPNTDPKTTNLVEPGTYQMVIVDAVEQYDGENRCFWEIKFHSDNPLFDCSKRFYHTEKAINMLRILLRACGLPYHGPVEVFPQTLVSKVLAVEVEVQTYVNKHGRQVQLMNPVYNGFYTMEEKRDHLMAPSDIPF